MTNSLFTKLKRAGFWNVVRNCAIIFTVCFIVLFFYTSQDREEGYLSLPFVEPWLPAFFSTNRVTKPNDNQSPFLVELKNPCYLKSDEGRVYGDVLSMSESELPSTLRYPSSIQVAGIDGTHTQETLRCLPYYFVLGWAKCGTSDLHEKMMAHPYILRAPTKEPAWFNNHRFSKTESFAPLSSYIDYYDYSVTSRIAKYFHRYGSQVPLIVGDHSTHTIDIARLTDRGFTYNNKSAPAGTGKPDADVLKQYSSPLLVKQLIPNAKFIVLMRDPVSRLWSLYRMHEANSVEDFHAGCEIGIKLWTECIASKRPLSVCMYSKLNKKGVLDGTEPDSEWTSRAVGSVRRGIYYLYLAEWFSILPREHFLTLKFENWVGNASSVLNKEVFPFLGLPKLAGFNAKSMAIRSHMQVRRSRPKKDGSYVKSWSDGDMLPETRKLLSEFYAPYNDKLADFLKDKDFTWKYMPE